MTYRKEDIIMSKKINKKNVKMNEKENEKMKVKVNNVENIKTNENMEDKNMSKTEVFDNNFITINDVIAEQIDIFADKVESHINCAEAGIFNITKDNIDTFRDFGCYAAKKAYLKEEDSYVTYIHNSLKRESGYRVEKEFWDAFASELKEDFEGVLTKLIDYFKNHQEDYEDAFDLDFIVLDYVDYMLCGGNKNIALYLADELLSVVRTMISNIANEEFDKDFVDTLSEEELKKYKLLNDLIRYNVGTSYILYLLKTLGVVHDFVLDLYVQLNLEKWEIEDEEEDEEEIERSSEEVVD